VSLPADTTAAENAIAAWIAAATGIAAARIWWEGQGQCRDAGVWVLLAMLSEEGMDLGTDTKDAPTPQDGAEIVHIAREWVRQIVTIQVFKSAPTGEASGLAMMKKIRGGSRLPTARQALSAGGVGLGTFGNARNVGSPRSAAEFEPRAVMDVVVFLASEASETGTYIEKASGRGTVTP
jgi:hypothetical protein